MTEGPRIRTLRHESPTLVRIDGVLYEVPDANMHPESDEFCSRRIVVRGEYVVKLGYKQNRRELKLWRTMDHEDKRFFAPILRFGGGGAWIVQPLFTFKPGPRSNEAKSIIQRLADKYELVDIDPDFPWNWGVNLETKEPVIYDYAL